MSTGKAPRKPTPFMLQRREQVIEYLSRPDLEAWPTRKEYFKVIGASGTNPYTYFSSHDLAEMEEEALQRRRARCSADLVKVDQALLNKALSGNVDAIKLFYQRFDGFVEQRKLTGAVALQHEDKGLTRALEDMFNKLRDRTTVKVIDSQPASRLPLSASQAGHKDSISSDIPDTYDADASGGVKIDVDPGSQGKQPAAQDQLIEMDASLQPGTDTGSDQDGERADNPRNNDDDTPPPSHSVGPIHGYTKGGGGGLNHRGAE